MEIESEHVLQETFRRGDSIRSPEVESIILRRHAISRHVCEDSDNIGYAPRVG